MAEEHQSALNSWREGKIIARRDLTPRLFSLVVDAPVPHKAGQFVSIGLPARPEDHMAESIIARPYSLINAPDETLREFLIVKVEGGLLSPRLAALRAGDVVALSEPAGFLSCDDLPQRETLWMIATGTGIAPFISLLQTQTTWEKFSRVVLVHGVRYAEESTSISRLSHLRAARGERLRLIVCLTSPSKQAVNFSEEGVGAEKNSVITGRVTQALESGALERAANIILLPETSQVMLCGNPAMIEETQALLKNRGLTRHRLAVPGNITHERYW